MKTLHQSSCGSKDKGDILITMVQNNSNEIKVNLASPSMFQFGKHIKTLIIEELKKLEANSLTVTLEDNGALDFTIKSRIETCYDRLTKKNDIDWRSRI